MSYITSKTITYTVLPKTNTSPVVFLPRYSRNRIDEVKGFNRLYERDFLIKHMGNKLGREVEQSTLYDQWDSLNNKYSKKDIPMLESFKKGLWSPTDITNVEMTISEINNLNPTLVIAPNPTEWGHLRRCVSSMNYSRGPGRCIKYYMIDLNTELILGIAEVSSSFYSIGPRDRKIGLSSENKQEGKLNHICMGTTIVPVGQFGFNFLGGKLLTCLLTSTIVQDDWLERYGDRIVGFETTSLKGHKKSGGSMYTGLGTVIKSIGHTSGNTPLFPDDKMYKRCTTWLKRYFSEEYKRAVAGSRPKNAILSLICKKLGVVKASLNHGFKRGCYWSPLYTDTNDFLKGEINEVTTKRFDNSPESLIKRWRQKAINRYLKMVRHNRIKKEIQYNTDMIGKSWKEVQIGKFGVTITKKVTIINIEPSLDQYTKPLVTVSHTCLNQRSNVVGMLSHLYNSSFRRPC